MDVQKELEAMREPAYAEFAWKLAPTLPREAFLGVRVPNLRKLASRLAKAPEKDAFLHALPHRFYEENLLHSILLQRNGDYDQTLSLVDAFLPFVDNWAVCDTLRPRSFDRHREELFAHVVRWMQSEQTYTARFGVDMLMTHYLKESFRAEYLELPAQISCEEYYVHMMVAWFYATALTEQWEATLPILEAHRLDRRTHNKAIQKAIESNRITDAQKDFLRTLRWKDA